MPGTLAQRVRGAGTHVKVSRVLVEKLMLMLVLMLKRRRMLGVESLEA
jgi:hypothetical protein